PTLSPFSRRVFRIPFRRRIHGRLPTLSRTIRNSRTPTRTNGTWKFKGSLLQVCFCPLPTSAARTEDFLIPDSAIPRAWLRRTARRTQPSTHCGPCHGWPRISITPPARDTRTTMPWNRSCKGAFRRVSIPSFRIRGASLQISAAVISTRRMDRAEVPASKTTTTPIQPAAFRLTTSRTFYRGLQATSFRSAKRNDGRKTAWHRGSQADGRRTTSCKREQGSPITSRFPVILRTCEEGRRRRRALTSGLTLLLTRSRPVLSQLTRTRSAKRPFHKAGALRTRPTPRTHGLILVRSESRQTDLGILAAMPFVGLQFSIPIFPCSKASPCAKV